MTMSNNTLRKTPTQWLDSNDENGFDIGGDPLDLTQSEENKASLMNWDFIMGKPSRETSPDGKRRTDESTDDAAVVQVTTSENSQVTRVFKRISLFGKTAALCGFFGSCQRRSKSPWTEIGRARAIRNRALLVVRGLCMCALGLSAGLAFAMRNTVPKLSLLSELFVWLHFVFLLLIPFLVLGSLKTMYLQPEDIEEDEDSLTRSMWIVVGVTSHVAGALSQTELVRLFVLHSAPSLQPSARVGADELYSLNSAFALQRYLMAATSVLELLFCAAPQRVGYVVIVFFLSMCWEVPMYHSRSIEKTVGERLALMLGSIALAVNLSAINVVCHRIVTAWNSDMWTTEEPNQNSNDIC